MVPWTALSLEEIWEVLSFVLVINLSLFAEHTGIIDVAVLLPTAEERDNKSNGNTLHCNPRCTVSSMVIYTSVIGEGNGLRGQIVLIHTVHSVVIVQQHTTTCSDWITSQILVSRERAGTPPSHLLFLLSWPKTKDLRWDELQIIRLFKKKKKKIPIITFMLRELQSRTGVKCRAKRMKARAQCGVWKKPHESSRE